MKGAKGDEPAKTINTPTSSSTEISGMSHHFFSCLTKRKNSLMMDCLAIHFSRCYRIVTLSAVRNSASNLTLRRIPASKSTRDGFCVTMKLPITSASIPVFTNVW